MNSIKFRAWDSRNGEMRYSDRHDGEFYINLKGVLYMYAIPNSNPYTEYKTYDVMSFTGLLDKNEKEVYVGDIIKWRTINPDYDFDKDTDEETNPDWVVLHDEVVFKDGQFKASSAFFGFEGEGLVNLSFCEVVGNIYETPTLTGLFRKGQR
jgi:uncharacterized phage protein (TIGR01671 family)